MSLANGCLDLRGLDLCGYVPIIDESVVALANNCPHIRSLGLYYYQNITERDMYSLAHSRLEREQHSNTDSMWESVKNKYEEELVNLNISQCTALTPPAVQRKPSCLSEAFGNVVSFMVFLAPVPTFRKIYKKKSTEGFQSLNYVIGMFSAMLWIYYAFLKPGTTLLVTINSVGCFIQTIYICFYLFYAPRNAKIQTAKMLILLLVIGFGLVVGLTHYLVKGETRAYVVGWICLVFSLCVFVAPLAILRKVIRTKSVEYMPILLSFFLTLSAVVWFFYGLLIKDRNIAIPNVLGFIFGILQMVLYFIYKKKKTAINVDQKLSKEEAVPKIIDWDREEKKITGLEEQIIDVMKLSSMVLTEIGPVVKIDVGSASENVLPKEIICG